MRAVKVCQFCAEPIVWREEVISKTETKWIPMEASLQDPSQPENFENGQYEPRGRTRVSAYGKKPKTLIKHVCHGKYVFSKREAGIELPSWRDW